MEKKLLWIFHILSIIFCVFSVGMIGGSAVEYPALMVVPEATSDETLTLGMYYNVSIRTDYDGTDIWGWQFTLYYNPNVLHGGINNTDMFTGDGLTDVFALSQAPVVPHSEEVYVGGILMTRDVDYLINYEFGMMKFTTAPTDGAEIKVIYLYNGVVNGDLITTAKHPDAAFSAGTFNNTLGKLSLTAAFFFYAAEPPPTTYGPGILANVTFIVVGYGSSNITIGLEKDETKLDGYDETIMEFYTIIEAYRMPDHIQHGYFRNLIAGDANGDGIVNIFDIGAISAHWYPGPPIGPLGYGREADLNLDGSVNIFDIGIASANWGNTAP